MHQFTRWAMAGSLAVAVAAAADDKAGFPGPGLYRIESEAVMTSGRGPTATEVTSHTDGATGDLTVTSKAALNPKGAVQHFAGSKPNTWCVGSGPIRAPPGANWCDARSSSVDAKTTELKAKCNALTVDERWRRVDDVTWERRATMEVLPPESTAMVPAATTAALAPVVAQLEAEARSGDAARAAQAKQQLEMLKASLGQGATPAATEALKRVTRLTETWVRVAACVPEAAR